MTFYCKFLFDQGAERTVIDTEDEGTALGVDFVDTSFARLPCTGRESADNLILGSFHESNGVLPAVTQ